jgi:hypothetical protein
MNVRGSLGLTALLTGEPDAAEDALREELRLCRELALRPVAFTGLLGMAAIAASRGEIRRAARLAGAAATHRHGQPEQPLDARLHATFLQSARRRCGADAWDAAAREGAALGLEHAITDALEQPRA